MATNNKKPTHTLRCGNIKATIWQNDSEKGPFFATTFSRPFKDQSGAWRSGTSYGLNDLESITVSGIEGISGDSELTNRRSAVPSCFCET
jgi:hypothetical protein